MNKKKWIWQLPFLLLLIVGTVLIIRQQRAMPYQMNSGMVFGTVYNITYFTHYYLYGLCPIYIETFHTVKIGVISNLVLK